MSEKRSADFKVVAKEKRSRNMIPFNTKLDIISRNRNGDSVNSISQTFNLPQSTVRSIIDNAEKIITCFETTGNLNMVQISKSRDSLVENMEKLLYEWIVDQQSLGAPIHSMSIKEKARSIWHSLKESNCDESSESLATFKASSGWLERFKKRMNLNITNEKKPIVHQTVTESKKFISYFQECIKEHDYSLKQIFNIDECELSWKTLACIPTETHNNDKAIVVLGSNAEGDFKLNPLLIYRSETPGPIEEWLSVPIFKKPHSKVLLTQSIFEEYIVSYVSPAIRQYCKENGLEDKSLLIIDNASGHPFEIECAVDNIKVIFLPSLTTLLQPLESLSFQLCNRYEICSSRFILSQSEALGQPLVECLNNYNIDMAAQNLAEAWYSISPEEIGEAWSIILSDDLNDEDTFQQSTSKEVPALIGLERNHVDDSSNKDESIKEEARDQVGLMNICMKQDDDDRESDEQLPATSLDEVFKLVEKAKDILKKDDPLVERSTFCCNIIDQALQCYKEFYSCNNHVLT